MKKGILGSWVWSVLFSVIVSVGIFTPTEVQARSYAQMDCYSLWYARNAIFADKGQCFESARAVNTFGRRCYPPYGRLNGWEKSQVSDIKYWERRKGCRNGYARAPVRQRSRYARVTGIRWDDTLAVRSGPSTRYRRIGNLPPDATGVRILECTRRWCRIRYGGITGWSYAKYLRSY